MGLLFPSAEFKLNQFEREVCAELQRKFQKAINDLEGVLVYKTEKDLDHVLIRWTDALGSRDAEIVRLLDELVNLKTRISESREGNGAEHLA